MRIFFGFRFGSVAISVVTVVMIATLSLSASTMYQFSQATKTVANNENVINETQRLAILLLDAETGQRGYIITGIDEYLDVYQHGVDGFQTRYASLLSLADAPEVKDKVIELGRLATPKLLELADVIRVRRTVGFDEASAMVKTHVGKNLMDDFRTKVKDLITTAQNRMDKYNDVAEEAAGWATINLLIGMVSLFLWTMLLAQREPMPPEMPPPTPKEKNLWAED